MSRYTILSPCLRVLVWAMYFFALGGIVENNLSMGAPIQDPYFKSRYSDKVEFNVKIGTDAIFNYSTYPFNVIYRMIFDKFIDGRPFEQGSCMVNDTTQPCNRTDGRVVFVNPQNAPPYIILPNITDTDAGQYRTRVIKDNVPVNPGLIDIETTVHVFKEDYFLVSIDVTNVHGGFHNFTLDQSPYRPKTPILVNPDKTHTWNVRLHPNSPKAHILIKQRVGNSSSPMECPELTRECSRGIIFYNSDYTKEWDVEIIVNCFTQNVPKLNAKFHVEQVLSPSARPPIHTIVATTVTPAVAALLIGLLYHRFGVRHEREKRHRTIRLDEMKRNQTEDITKLVTLVPDSELEDMEYVYKLDIPKKCTPDSDDAQPVIAAFIKLTTALMNTSGGIIKCKFDNQISVKLRNNWFEELIRHTTEWVKNDISKACIHPLKDKSSFYVRKAFQRLYIDNGIHSSPEENPNNCENRATVETLITNIADRILFEEEYKDSLSSFREPDRIFHKLFSSTDEQDIFESVRRHKEEPKGGNIFFGVDISDQEKPIGFHGINANELTNIHQSCNTFFRKSFPDEHIPDQTEVNRYWYTQKMELRKNHLLSSNRYIVKWHIYGPQENKLHRLPTALGIRDDGHLYQLSLKELADHARISQTDMYTKTTETRDLMNDDGVQDTENEPLLKANRDSYVMNISPAENRQDSFFKQPAATNQRQQEDHKWYNKKEMRKPTDKALQHQVLSWNKHSTAWDQERASSSMDNYKMLIPTNPFTFVPNKHVICSSVGKEMRPTISTALQYIADTLEGEGYAVKYADTSLDQSFIFLVVVSQGIELLFLVRLNQCVHMYTAGRKVKKHFLAILEQIGYTLKSGRGSGKEGIALNILSKRILLPKHWDLPFHKETVEVNELSSRINSPVYVPAELVHRACYEFANSQEVTTTHRLGNKRLLKLTADQASVLTAMICDVNFVEGPPGSGKSLLSTTLYKQKCQHSEKVLFAAPTEPFLNLCKFRDIGDTMCVANEDDIINLSNSSNEYTTIIIDDVQHIDFTSMAIWNGLLYHLNQTGCKLYLFADSRFQNYKYTFSMENMKKEMKQYCDECKISFQEHRFTKVFRNSQKVCNFMAVNASKDGEENIVCGHNVPGDDVLVYPVANYREQSDHNAILNIVQDVLGRRVPGTKYHHNVPYAPSDIAILFDSEDAEDKVSFFLELFHHFKPTLPTQRADKYPVEGLVIETLDKFCGLDAPVCVVISDCKNDPRKKLDNERYKLFIASRGINLVILVLPTEDMTSEQADNLCFDKLSDVLVTQYSKWNTDLADIPAMLEVVRHTEDGRSVVRVLSAIAGNFEDKEVAQSYVDNGGIDIALTVIKSYEDDEVCERALVTMNMVAIHETTRTSLMSKDVIEVVCGCLKKDHPLASWEACYLLVHLFSCGHETWPSAGKEFVETVQLVTKAIDDLDVDDTDGVAYGEVDFKAYKRWLESPMEVQQYMASWTLCNLAKTSATRHCPQIKKYIGYQRIEDHWNNTDFPCKAKKYLQEIIEVFNEMSIMSGAFVRDYKPGRYHSSLPTTKD